MMNYKPGFLIISLILAFSCNQPPTQQYQQPQAQVVYVQQPDGSSIMMNYLLWKSLMDQGGETHVHNYYNQHRNDDEFRPERQQQYRQIYEHEKVQTQKSDGFGTKPVETNKSNGFGSKPVETQKSTGFGNYKPTTTIPPSSTSVQTQRSAGFGSKSITQPIKTNSSSGFGKNKNGKK